MKTARRVDIWRFLLMAACLAFALLIGMAWTRAVAAQSPVPDLQIAKSDGVTLAIPGELLTYTLVITNVGEQDATGVAVTDTLPAHTFYLADSTSPGGSYNAGAHQVAWSIGSLSAGQTVTCSLAVTVTVHLPAGVSVITNTATVADDGAYGADATPSDNIALDVDALDAAPDLTLAKTDGESTVRPGDVLTYMLTITNVGDQDATGVTLTDTLPANVAYVAGSATHGGSYDADEGMVSWLVGHLAAGTSLSRTYAVSVGRMPAGVFTLENQAWATDDGANGPDPHPADNWAYDTDSVDAQPDIAVIKSDGQATVRPGDRLTYTLAIANLGDQGATGVVATDTLPAHVTYVPGSAGDGVYSAAAREIVWSIGGLAAGGSLTRTYQVTVAPLPAGVTAITNTVVVADDGANGTDPTPANNSTQDADDVIATPDLTLAKTDGETTVRPGDMLTYVLTLANVGDQGATGVRVTDTLPSYVAYVAGSATPGGSYAAGQVTWFIDNLAAGESITRSYGLMVEDPLPAGVTAITNTAVVADDGTNKPDPTPGDNSAQDVDVLDAAPNLTLVKTDGRAAVQPGSVLTYVLTLANVGDQSATGVTLTDTLPAHVNYISGSASDGGVFAAGQITWSIGDLAVGQTITRSYGLIVEDPLSAGVSAITNTALAADDGANGLDPTPGDNSAWDVDALDAAPDLTIVNTDGETVVQPGDLLTYVLTIANVGDQDATGVRVTDTLPAHASYVLASASYGGSYASGQVTWLVGALPAGQTITRSYGVMVDNQPAGVTAITNTVVVADDGANGPDPAPANNSAQDVDDVIAAPDLTIGKTDGVLVAQPGQGLTYVLTLANVGDQGATGVRVTDTLPSYVAYVAGTATHGGSYAAGQVTWAIDALAAGQTVTRSYRALVDAAVPADALAITNTARVADDGANGPDPTPANNAAADTDALDAQPLLGASKTAALWHDADGLVSPGDRLRYTLIITNSGGREATGVALSDAPGEHTALVAGSVQASAGVTITCGNAPGDTSVAATIGRLAGAGGAVTLTLDVTLASPLSLDVLSVANQAFVRADGLADAPSDDPATPEPGDATVTRIAWPDLEVTKTVGLHQDRDGNGVVSPGDALQYMVRIANRGDGTARGLTFTDTVDAHTALSVGSTTTSRGAVTVGNLPGDASVGVHVGDLPGDDATATIRFRVVITNPLAEGVEQIANQGRVAGDNVRGQPTDDPATPTPDDPTLIQVLQAPIIAAIQWATLYTDADASGMPSPGDTLQYTVRITNSGSGAATGVVFSDTLDSNTALEVGSVVASQGDVTRGNTVGDGAVEVALGAIPIAGWAEISYRALIHLSIPAGVTTVTNQGMVSGEHVIVTLTDDPTTPAAGDGTVTIISPPTYVGLLYLLARPVSAERAQLLWATAVEVDNLGFHLYRSATADWGQVAWVAWVSTQAQGGAGAAYAYDDALPYAGAWWYWIEDVNSRGGRVLHGPTQAIAAKRILHLPVLAR